MNHRMRFRFKLKTPLWFLKYQLLDGEVCPENGRSAEEPYHTEFSLHSPSRTNIRAYYQLVHNTI